jgi:inward rectifier potassium channel
MRSRVTREVYRGEGYDTHVIGGRPAGFRDLYHTLLRVSWPQTLGLILGAYLALNAVFAALYLASGGIAMARPGSFADAFMFSVETMGTIGYGNMYPANAVANLIVVAESLLGILVIAVVTGLVFARFSQTRARMAFSSRIAVGPVDGVPHLMIRVGNERRRNNIVEARFRLSLMRTTITSEGITIYRTVDLSLVRDRAPALARSWMVLHRIDPSSPLHGETPASLAASEAELTLSVAGVDDTSLQSVHARHTWFSPSVVFGARLADVVSDEPDRLVLDLRRFHDLVPTAPAPGFPYSAALPAEPAPGPGPEAVPRAGVARS